MDDKDVVGAGVVSAAVQVYPSSPDMFVAEPISRVSTRDSCVAHQLSRQLGQATSMSRVALRGTQRTTAVSRVNVHERSFMNVDRSFSGSRHTSHVPHIAQIRCTTHIAPPRLRVIRHTQLCTYVHIARICTMHVRRAHVEHTTHISRISLRERSSMSRSTYRALFSCTRHNDDTRRMRVCDDMHVNTTRRTTTNNDACAHDAFNIRRGVHES